jgi:ribonuclease HI
MSVPAPHFLLYAEAAQAADCAASNAGRWRFVLRQPGGETSLEAADEEPEAGPDRLELLAVVRGLEALESPSRVTLVTGSRNIRRGLDSGLSQWRETGWQWERYGRLTPVKNGDLWRRLDRLLEIHSIHCRPSRIPSTDDLAAPAIARKSAAPRAKRIRVDAAHSRDIEPQNRKLVTNFKFKKRSASTNHPHGPRSWLARALFQISHFVFRLPRSTRARKARNRT